MKFRPASDVARDLLRDATPKTKRAPTRPSHSVELIGVRVVSIRPHGPVNTIVLSITESDRVRLSVAARGFMSAGARVKRKAEGEVILPIVHDEAGATLTAQIDNLPNHLTPGTVLSRIKITFAIDAMADVPTIRALAEKIVIAEAEVVVAPITLGAVTLTGLSDNDVGLEEDPIAQAKAERYILAVIAYQNRMRGR